MCMPLFAESFLIITMYMGCAIHVHVLLHVNIRPCLRLDDSSMDCLHFEMKFGVPTLLGS